MRYRFRCYPTPAQAEHIAQLFGCTRVVYNKMLALRTDSYAEEGKSIGYHETSKALTELKRTEGYEWLNDVSCVPLQQGLRHLNTAFVNFFKQRARYPRFKRRSHTQSAEFTASAFKYAEGKLSLAKIGRLHVVWSRGFTSQPTTVTLSKTASDKYFVTLVVDEVRMPKPKTGKSVGVDLGISRLATYSDGTRIANPRYTAKYAAQLAKAQRLLSRKTKGSGRWHRQRVKVARIHDKITNTRRDHLHKVTTTLVTDYDVIAVEDLNVRGMVRMRSLAKHISCASFGEFRTMLEYKCAWYGKELRILDRFFPSSKRCNDCGHIQEAMPLNVRTWECPECKKKNDRDRNAACNIRDFAAGQVV